MSENPTSARIVQATRALLKERQRTASLARITVGEAAAAAHVSRATLYRYFPDRAALLRAAGVAEETVAATPRARIFEATLQVIARRGIHAATLDEIAEHAGLSRSGLIWHFRNKDELMAAFAQNVPAMQLIADAVAPPDAPGAPMPDFETQLTQITQVALASLDKYGRIIPHVLLDATLHPDTVELASRHTIGRVLRLLTELIEQHTRSGELRPGPAQIRAQAIAGLYISFTLLRHTFAPLLAADEEATMREYVNILLHGMLAAPQAGPQEGTQRTQP